MDYVIWHLIKPCFSSVSKTDGKCLPMRIPSLSDHLCIRYCIVLYIVCINNCHLFTNWSNDGLGETVYKFREVVNDGESIPNTRLEESSVEIDFN